MAYHMFNKMLFSDPWVLPVWPKYTHTYTQSNKTKTWRSDANKEKKSTNEHLEQFICRAMDGIEKQGNRVLKKKNKAIMPSASW